MTDLRFDITPQATPLGTILVSLTTANSLKAGSGVRVELNGTGSGRIVINRKDPNCTAVNLADGNYVRAYDTTLGEYVAGFWLPNGTVKLLSETEGGDQDLTIEGAGSLAYLGRAIWLNAAYVAPGGGTGVGDATNSPRTDGLWHWPNNKLGSILERAVLEAQDPDRPDQPIPALTKDFTYALDSAGAAFSSFTGDFTTPVGNNYIPSIEDVIRAGITVLCRPNLLLQAYQNAYGRDKHSATFAAGKVRFLAATNIVGELPRQLQPNMRVRKLLVQGQSSDPASMVLVTDAGAPASEAYLNYGITDDAAVLAAAGAANIAMRTAQTDIAKIVHRPGQDDSAGEYTPGWPGGAGQYWLGDTVTLHTGTAEFDYNNQSIRVAAIEWKMKAGGNWNIAVELGSTYYDFGQPGQQAIGGEGAPGSQPCTCGPTPAPTCVGSAATVLYQWHFEFGNNLDDATHTLAFAGVWDNGLNNAEPFSPSPHCYANSPGYLSSSIPISSGARLIFDMDLAYQGGATPPTDVLVHFRNGATVLETWPWAVGTDYSAGSGGGSPWVGPIYHVSKTHTAPAGTDNIQVEASYPYRCDNVVILAAGSVDPLCTAPFTYGDHYIPGPGGYYAPAGSQITAPKASEVPYSPTGGLTATNVQTAIEQVQAEIVGLPTGVLPWFNVKNASYGAVGDGTTNDTAAINLAIVALNAAGRGILYFPAGDYKCTTTLTTISVPFIVLGDGSMSFDGAVFGSRVKLTSGSVDLFSVSAKIGLFKDIGLLSNSGGAPSAGAAVHATSGYLEQKTDFENVHSRGFYDGLDIAVGAQWVMHNVLVTAPVRYGIRIRNTVNADAGDWSISDCNIYADAYNATSAIRIETSGGGKIVNTKVNMALSGNRFATGIDLAAAGTSVILHIANCSVENVTTAGISVTGANWKSISIIGFEFGGWGSATVKPIVMTAATLGDLSYVVIDDVVALNDTVDSAYVVELTKIDHATIGQIEQLNFAGKLTTSGCTNITDNTAPATPLTVKDEGTPLATAATSLDFVGAGVTATGTGAAKTITIPGGAAALDDLTDVTITSPATNNALLYNGSQWVNSAAIWRPLMDGAGNVITDAGTGEAIMALS